MFNPGDTVQIISIANRAANQSEFQLNMLATILECRMNPSWGHMPCSVDVILENNVIVLGCNAERFREIV